MRTALLILIVATAAIASHAVSVGESHQAVPLVDLEQERLALKEAAHNVIVDPLRRQDQHYLQDLVEEAFVSATNTVEVPLYHSPFMGVRTTEVMKTLNEMIASRRAAVQHTRETQSKLDSQLRKIQMKINDLESELDSSLDLLESQKRIEEQKHFYNSQIQSYEADLDELIHYHARMERALSPSSRLQSDVEEDEEESAVPRGKNRFWTNLPHNCSVPIVPISAHAKNMSSLAMSFEELETDDPQLLRPECVANDAIVVFSEAKGTPSECMVHGQFCAAILGGRVDKRDAPVQRLDAPAGFFEDFRGYFELEEEEEDDENQKRLRQEEDEAATIGALEGTMLLQFVANNETIKAPNKKQHPHHHYSARLVHGDQLVLHNVPRNLTIRADLSKGRVNVPVSEEAVLQFSSGADGVLALGMLFSSSSSNNTDVHGSGIHVVAVGNHLGFNLISSSNSSSSTTRRSGVSVFSGMSVYELQQNQGTPGFVVAARHNNSTSADDRVSVRVELPALTHPNAFGKTASGLFEDAVRVSGVETSVNIRDNRKKVSVGVFSSGFGVGVHAKRVETKNKSNKAQHDVISSLIWQIHSHPFTATTGSLPADFGHNHNIRVRYSALDGAIQVRGGGVAAGGKKHDEEARLRIAQQPHQNVKLGLAVSRNNVAVHCDGGDHVDARVFIDDVELATASISRPSTLAASATINRLAFKNGAIKLALNKKNAPAARLHFMGRQFAEIGIGSSNVTNTNAVSGKLDLERGRVRLGSRGITNVQLKIAGKQLAVIKSSYGSALFKADIDGNFTSEAAAASRLTIGGEVVSMLQGSVEFGSPSASVMGAGHVSAVLNGHSKADLPFGTSGRLELKDGVITMTVDKQHLGVMDFRNNRLNIDASACSASACKLHFHADLEKALKDSRAVHTILSVGKASAPIARYIASARRSSAGAVKSVTPTGSVKAASAPSSVANNGTAPSTVATTGDKVYKAAKQLSVQQLERIKSSDGYNAAKTSLKRSVDALGFASRHTFETAANSAQEAAVAVKTSPAFQDATRVLKVASAKVARGVTKLAARASDSYDRFKTKMTKNVQAARSIAESVNDSARKAVDEAKLLYGSRTLAFKNAVSKIKERVTKSPAYLGAKELTDKSNRILRDAKEHLGLAYGQAKQKLRASVMKSPLVSAARAAHATGRNTILNSVSASNEIAHAINTRLHAGYSAAQKISLQVQDRVNSAAMDAANGYGESAFHASQEFLRRKAEHAESVVHGAKKLHDAAAWISSEAMRRAQHGITEMADIMEKGTREAKDEDDSLSKETDQYGEILFEEATSGSVVHPEHHAFLRHEHQAHSPHAATSAGGAHPVAFAQMMGHGTANAADEAFNYEQYRQNERQAAAIAGSKTVSEAAEKLGKVAYKEAVKNAAPFKAAGAAAADAALQAENVGKQAANTAVQAVKTAAGSSADVEKVASENKMDTAKAADKIGDAVVAKSQRNGDAVRTDAQAVRSTAERAAAETEKVVKQGDSALRKETAKEAQHTSDLAYQTGEKDLKTTRDGAQQNEKVISEDATSQRHEMQRGSNRVVKDAKTEGAEMKRDASQVGAKVSEIKKDDSMSGMKDLFRRGTKDVQGGIGGIENMLKNEQKRAEVRSVEKEQQNADDSIKDKLHRESWRENIHGDMDKFENLQRRLFDNKKEKEEMHELRDDERRDADLKGQERKEFAKLADQVDEQKKAADLRQNLQGFTDRAEKDVDQSKKIESQIAKVGDQFDDSQKDLRKLDKNLVDGVKKQVQQNNEEKQMQASEKSLLKDIRGNERAKEERAAADGVKKDVNSGFGKVDKAAETAAKDETTTMDENQKSKEKTQGLKSLADEIRQSSKQTEGAIKRNSQKELDNLSDAAKQASVQSKMGKLDKDVGKIGDVAKADAESVDRAVTSAMDKTKDAMAHNEDKVKQAMDDTKSAMKDKQRDLANDIGSHINSMDTERERAFQDHNDALRRATHQHLDSKQQNLEKDMENMEQGVKKRVGRMQKRDDHRRIRQEKRHTDAFNQMENQEKKAYRGVSKNPKIGAKGAK